MDSLMSANNSNQPLISTVAELNPEPEPRFRRHIWEALLGILLLAGILLWAGWQWWDRETKAAEHSTLMQKAVAGTIAVRPEAEPPGLYYWDEDGWVWLKDSDARSRLTNNNTYRRRVIYDAAGPDWSTDVSLTPETNQENDGEVHGSPSLQGRRLVAAGFDESNRLRFDELAFDPAEYDNYVAGEHGVWAMRLSEDVPASTPPRELTINDYSLDYQAMGSQVVSNVMLPGPDWYIVRMHTDGERLMLGEVTDDEANVGLYIAEGDGSAATWVYSHTDPLDVDFSHDGRYALLKTSEWSNEDEIHGFVWIDLLGQMPPKLLAEQTREDQEGFITSGVVSGFVRGGPNGERIFIAERAPGSKTVTLRMLDASMPEKELLTVPLDDTSLRWIIWSRDPKTSVEALFLVKDIADAPLTGVTVSLYPGRPPLIGTLSPKRGFPLHGPYVKNGRLVYVDIQDSKDVLYTVPLPDENGEELQVTSVFTSTEKLEATGNHIPFFFGPELFSYVDNGSLYAHSYDGPSNMLLENGVTELSWGLRPETILLQFR